ncbi:MAG: TonB-dependent receptor [Flavobacteriales bacterium]|nr:TonB-dependent receptor [Flavobacteriales bacterium]
MRKFLFFFLTVISVEFALAQHTISGRITAESGIALGYAEVEIHETHQVVFSDTSGFYVIKNVKNGHYHLHITHVGFHAQHADIEVQEDIRNLNFVLEESINELHQVVIETSADKSDFKNNSIQVQHIDNHFLQRQGSTSLVKSMEKISGISAYSTGVGVSKPVIRGLSGNRVVVAYNGIKQEGQQWGADHGLEIDLNNADKVEIIKGPAGLIFGSDAVAGVINIRPKLPHKENAFNAANSLTFNSINNSWRNSFFVSANKKGIWTKWRYSYLNGGDYKIPADKFVFQTTVLPVYNQRLKNTAINEGAITAQLGVSKNWGYSYLNLSEFSQKSGFFSGAFGVPNASKLQHDGDYRNIDLPYQFVSHRTVSSHTNLMVKRNWLEVDAGFQQNHRQEWAVPHNNAFISDSSNRNLSIDLVLTTWSVNARYYKNDSVYRHILGFSLQHKNNRIRGYEFLIPAYKTAMAAAFWSAKRNLKHNWKLSMGVRFELNTLQFDSTTTSFYQNGVYAGEAFRNESFKKTFLLNSGAIGLNKTFKNQLMIKANLAKTHRVVQANELASNGLHHGAFRFEKGDISLKPENAVQSDISMFYEKSRWLLNSSVYFNHFFNFIYLRPSAQYARLIVENQIYAYPEAGQLYEYKQAVVQHIGFELDAEYRLKTDLNFKMAADYTQINNRSVGEYIPFVPPLAVKNGLEWVKKKKWKGIEEMHAELFFELYAPQKRVPRNDIATQAYQLLNANISFETKRGLIITLAGNNLLNANYFSNLSRYKIIGLPEPGRSLVVGLTYNFER